MVLYTHTEVRAGFLETEICQVHNEKTVIGAIKKLSQYNILLQYCTGQTVLVI